MNGFQKGWVAAALCIVGIWGCAQGPTGGNASGDRLKALEMRAAKLEEDFRTTAAARDLFRKKLTTAEEEDQALRRRLSAAEETAQQLRSQTEERLESIIRERDEFRAQLSIRTAERDALQGQYEQFRKTIREVVGQADSGNMPPTPVSAVSAPQ
jgi:chromosome segregation ATPase